MSDVTPITNGDGARSPGEDVRTAVTEVTGSVLDSGTVDADRSFLDQGGDSLSALALAETLGDKLGVDVPLELVFDSDDLNDLADQLARRLDEPDAAAGA
ncbi:MAG: acyl carrier protein [Actinocatenispora sp.]